MGGRIAAEGEALLLYILPLFTSSISLVTSHPNIYFVNFWTLFCAEAQILESWLVEDGSNINKQSESYLDILENILGLFESLVSEGVFSPSPPSNFLV